MPRRMVLGHIFLRRPRSREWRYSPWDFSAERDVFILEPSTPHVPAVIFNATHDWSAAGEDRDRLAENALRVAYVASNQWGGKGQPRGLDGALCSCSGKENLAEFKPAKGAGEAEECVKTVLAASRKRTGRTTTGVTGQETSPVREGREDASDDEKELISGKLIGFDKASGCHYLTEEKSISVNKSWMQQSSAPSSSVDFFAPMSTASFVRRGRVDRCNASQRI